ncbi:hypothetical protein SNE40_002410 [Patella caerulea]|uniref:Uncharacterized protein n=1 Tax=Patella caerulea TaxID=87958 RepID=A0AAN8K3N3_PATCE
MDSPNSNVDLLLQEFKEPQTIPADKVFCEQKSVEEYKENITNETHKHLEELVEYLEKNPQSYNKILLKRKVEEIENGGFFPWLKLTVLRWLHGNDCPSCMLKAEETTSKLESLKTGMQKAFEYSEASKDKPIPSSASKDTTTNSFSIYSTPVSKTPGSRKKQRLDYLQTQESPFVQIHMAEIQPDEQQVHQSYSPPPLPPLPSKLFTRSAQKAHIEMVHPPLPPTPQPNNEVYTRVNDNTENINPDQSSETVSTSSASSTSHVTTSTPNTFVTPKDIRVRKHRRTRSSVSKSSNGSTFSRSNLLSDLQSNNPLTRLRTTAVIRSPGGTPIRQEVVESSEPLHQALIVAFKNKFRNVRTPSPLASQSYTMDIGHFSPTLNFSP